MTEHTTSFDLVILDCDGVLVDSEIISCGLLSEMLSPLDAAYDPPFVMQRYLGRSAKIILEDYDRLSGGALDQALFTTKAFVGAKFQVVIAVDATRRGEWVSENQVKKDLELLRRLAEDLQKNGLQLGHAAARGFGWCRIEDVKFGGALA